MITRRLFLLASAAASALPFVRTAPTGVLVEEQRTNLLLEWEIFDNYTWNSPQLVSSRGWHRFDHNGDR